MKLKSVRVKGGVCITCDFRKSARTLYDGLRADRKLWKGEPASDEVYVLVSTQGRQVYFIHGLKKIKSHPGTRYAADQELLDYRVWRIEGSTFSPKMLENYARQVGLTLQMRTFEDWYRDWYAGRHG